MRPYDDIAVLVGSPNRMAVLRAVVDGRATPRALAESANISRETVTTILDELAVYGWVSEIEQREYEATPTGRLVHSAVSNARDRFAAYSTLAPIVDCVPWSAIDLAPRDLVDATLTVASDANPFAPLSRLNTVTRQASHSRTATPVVDPHAFTVSLDRIIDGSLETELVVERWIGELFFEHDELSMAQALDSGLTLYLADDSIPLAVSVVEETVVIGVTEDDLAPRALVESTAPSVRDWAETYFETHRARAEETLVGAQ